MATQYSEEFKKDAVRYWEEHQELGVNVWEDAHVRKSNIQEFDRQPPAIRKYKSIYKKIPYWYFEHEILESFLYIWKMSVLFRFNID